MSFPPISDSLSWPALSFREMSLQPNWGRINAYRAVSAP